jgi:hypothetical protein
MSKARSPQEKKALSYGRDGRNAYGQNDKASRKLVPLRKAQESRRDRHEIGQALHVLPRLGEAAAELAESLARQDTPRVGGWRKGPDVSLGEHVGRRLEAREERSGRKKRQREGNAGSGGD